MFTWVIRGACVFQQQSPRAVRPFAPVENGHERPLIEISFPVVVFPVGQQSAPGAVGG